jgi:ribosomal protein S8
LGVLKTLYALRWRNNVMILHLGGDTVVSTKNIIAILDVETAKISKTNREFLRIAEEEGFIQKISEDQPKSFILAEINKKSVIYLSPISSTTLLKRSSFVEEISINSTNYEGSMVNGKQYKI